MLITAHLDVCFSLSLLNSVSGVGRVGAWVAWVRGFVGDLCQISAWVHNILAWVKKNGVGGVGWNFSVGGVGPLNFGWGQKKSVGRNFGMGLRCFIKKTFLKTPQNLQENICAGVCT